MSKVIGIGQKALVNILEGPFASLQALAPPLFRATLEG